MIQLLSEDRDFLRRDIFREIMFFKVRKKLVKNTWQISLIFLSFFSFIFRGFLLSLFLHVTADIYLIPLQAAQRSSLLNLCSTFNLSIWYRPPQKSSGIKTGIGRGKKLCRKIWIKKIKIVPHSSRDSHFPKRWITLIFSKLTILLIQLKWWLTLAVYNRRSFCSWLCPLTLPEHEEQTRWRTMTMQQLEVSLKSDL